MQRRKFLSVVLSTVTILAASLPLVACGGGGGGDPVTPPMATTGINIQNSATDAGSQPHTHAITKVTFVGPDNVAADHLVNIAAGDTLLITVTELGQYRVFSIVYDDSLLKNVTPPTFFTLAEGDTPTYTAIRPATP